MVPLYWPWLPGACESSLFFEVCCWAITVHNPGYLTIGVDCWSCCDGICRHLCELFVGEVLATALYEQESC